MNAWLSISIAAITGATSCLVAAANADGSADVAAVTPIATQATVREPDCWVEHAQVQPPRVRRGVAAGEVAAAGEIAVALAGEHAGSEHKNPAALRPCAERPPTPK